uniref:C-type lectin domain-containing protein n=1 Tax=Amphiprion percula TaxID=161767 RepID=A0A3P8SMW8_AMPPE
MASGYFIICLTSLLCAYMCPRELQVVSKPETWRAALHYCRENNKELASARSKAENLIESVWIGLFQDEWKWSDQSASSFRYWHGTQPNNDGKCVLYNPSDRTWYDRDCAQKFLFCCYRGNLNMSEKTW